MDQKVTAISPRLFGNRSRRIRTTSQSPLRSWLLPTLQHPALSYGTEEASIHRSLDLSFQGGIAVSLVDRQIIDALISINQSAPCVQLLASGF
jgi:hypothetical protein